MRILLIHGSVWSIYIFFQVITYPPLGDSVIIQLIDVVGSFSTFIAVFYIYGLFILPKFLLPTRIIPFIFYQLVVLILFLSIHYLKYYYLLSPLDNSNFGQMSTYPLLLQFFRVYVYYALFGTGYWALYNYLEKEKKNIELEKNLLEAELSYLRYQFNPHFLYNSLSMIHSKAYPLSEDLSKAVLLLAKIMRYALQGEPGEKVPLSREIQHLENFIELHRMRFKSNFHVNFIKEGDAHGKEVISLVFISLVENAIKHGQTNNPASPILITIKALDEEIKFSTRNRKNKGEKEPSTGIGLPNIRRRLKLTYGNNYRLTVLDEEDLYYTELIIHKI